MKLIIAEKPKAARKIAEALGEFKVRKLGKAVYYDLGNIVVAPALGHLYSLFPAKKGFDYPIFEVEWKEKSLVKGFEHVRDYVRMLGMLAKKASEIIIATDYDVEGSVIGYNIWRFLAKNKPVKRMKFSTLTKAELRKAFEEAHELNEFEKGMVRAGLTRHYLDWFWGINLSRALSNATRFGGGFKILSTGRVQGPTLKILVDREREIRGFVPKEFFQLFAKFFGFRVEGPKFESAEKALQAFKKIGEFGVVEKVEKRLVELEAPPPFNLTDLQTEASRVFGLTPQETLKIAQKLYEDGLISYPRTSSQRIPKTVDVEGILRKLSRIYSTEACKFWPREGAKQDPAHPAIYPTGEFARLKGKEAKVFDLIVRRFLASMQENALREYTKVVISCNGVKFVLSGKRTVKHGWLGTYIYHGLEEKRIPEVREGQKVKVQSLELLRKQTSPPKRFSPAGLLKLMEKLNIGTKATRAQIIQTLYDRGYIQGKQSIRVTELGEKVVEVLEKYAPKIVSVDLTREFEEKMQLVHEGKERIENVLVEAKEFLSEVLQGFKEKSREIGKSLSTNSLGTCPYCGGKIILLRSRAGKKFAKCESCGRAWGVPQSSKISSKTCEKCGLRLLEVKVRGRKLYLCIIHGFVRKPG